MNGDRIMSNGERGGKGGSLNPQFQLKAVFGAMPQNRDGPRISLENAEQLESQVGRMRELENNKETNTLELESLNVEKAELGEKYRKEKAALEAASAST